MSPRFDPDLQKARASFPIHPRGDYELAVVEMTGLGYTKDNGDEISGARLNLEVVGCILGDGTLDRELEGQPCTGLRLYIHNEGSLNMTKQAIMAILGYTREEEDKFNDEVAGKLDLGIDWDEDSDEGEVTLGSGWSQLEGKHFIATLSKRSWEGREQQDIGGFMPVGG